MTTLQELYYNPKTGLISANKLYKKAKELNLNVTHKDIDRKCEFSGLKRVHKNITKENKEKGMNHFSIINNTQTRTFNKTCWSGMNLNNNVFYPKGHCNIL